MNQLQAMPSASARLAWRAVVWHIHVRVVFEQAAAPINRRQLQQALTIYVTPYTTEVESFLRSDQRGVAILPAAAASWRIAVPLAVGTALMSLLIPLAGATGAAIVALALSIYRRQRSPSCSARLR